MCAGISLGASDAMTKEEEIHNMKHVLGLVALSLFGLTACMVDPGAEGEDGTLGDEGMSDISSASPGNAIVEPTSQAAQALDSCYELWSCEPVCGNYLANVVHRLCYNGTYWEDMGLVYIGTCGADCY
jgi:hypothetical protein